MLSLTTFLSLPARNGYAQLARADVALDTTPNQREALSMLDTLTGRRYSVFVTVPAIGLAPMPDDVLTLLPDDAASEHDSVFLHPSGTLSRYYSPAH